MRRFNLRLRARFPSLQNTSLVNKSIAFGCKTWLHSGIVGIFTVITVNPVMANNANFASMSLRPGFDTSKSIVSGYTGGSYPLSAISNRDRDRKLCIGFADPRPDHILVLEKDFSNLRFLVDSAGADTTIVIQGPDDKTIRCGDDTGRKKDASIEGKDFKAGKYRIWIGVFNPGTRVNYTLSVQ